MTQELDGVATQLFEKIRARFDKVSVGDEGGKATTDPAQARFFNFDFIDEDGNNFGNVTISLIDEESLKVYFGKNLSADLDDAQKADWYNFLRDLRMFAMRNLLKFDTRDISRSNLNIKDIQQQAKAARPATLDDNLVAETAEFASVEYIQTELDHAKHVLSIAQENLENIKKRGGANENSQRVAVNKLKRQVSDLSDELRRAKTPVSEGKLYGTTKTSYESIAPGTRLIIRHSSPVDEAVHGARSRKIHAVYIEDAEGQRFKSPFTNLTGTRALARHISNGGQINDDFSSHIVEMCEEMSKIRSFIQGSRNKTFEDAEANDMVDAAKERYQTLHQMLGKLKNPRGYKFYKESWKPASTLQDDIDLEELKGKFVLKDFDDRLEAALPHVYRAYHAHKGAEMHNTPAINSHVDEFEESLDRIAEGTWEVPDNDMAIKRLQDLMSDVFPAGIDGADATAALQDIIGDDELYADIYAASEGSPDTDVRPIVYDWLQNNMPSVFEKIKGNIESGDEEEQPPAPEQEEPAAEEQPRESTDLSAIRRLAGIK